MIALRPLAAACLLGLTLPAAATESAASPPDHDPDWPCEQILVPQIEAAVIWQGPPVAGLDWRTDQEAATLVGRITPPGISPQESTAAITAFAGGLAPAERTARVTLVFAGVLERLNAERSAQIDGIRRYSHDQAQRAEALGVDLDHLVALERDPASAKQEQEELRKRLALTERVFDEREKAITYLCMRPVATEARLGLLARTLNGFLD
jgi:hypothetical protein